MTVVETPIAPSRVIEAEILERAADILEEWGHCKGDLFHDEDGEFINEWRIDDNRIVSYCAAGAIWRAAYEHGFLSGFWKDALGWSGVASAYRPVANIAGLTTRELSDFVRANDNQSTKAEIMAMLRAKARTQRRRDSLDRNRGKAI